MNERGKEAGRKGVRENLKKKSKPVSDLFFLLENVECGTIHCLNGGTCSKDGSSYICTCLDGYLGNSCQTSE